MARPRKQKEPDAEPELGGLEVDLSEPPKPNGNGAEQPQQQAAPEPEPIVVTQAPSVEDDEKLALKKRVEELERAEQTAKHATALAERAKEEALRQAQQHSTDYQRAQRDADQAISDSLTNAMGSAQAEMEAAQRDIEAGYGLLSQGDAGASKVIAEATRRMSMATTRYNTVEIQKAQYDAEQERKKSQPPPQQQQPQQQVPQQISRWINDHPEWMYNRRKNLQLQLAHEAVLERGLTMESPAYIEAIETEIGLRQPNNEQDDMEEERPRRQAVVSAPVSREATSVVTGRSVSQNKITLTPQQVEAADVSGVDRKEYARQLLRLQEEKKAGRYNNG